MTTPANPTPAALRETRFTVAEIKHAIIEDVFDMTAPNGVRYFVTWDESASLICAWPFGCDENAHASRVFGDDPEAAAREIHFWLYPENTDAR